MDFGYDFGFDTEYTINFDNEGNAYIATINAEFGEFDEEEDEYID